ncbi:MAG: T9SS type A sorting domain-containing protein [Bacteroidales bacterium]|nr:T9SS type A sorting domain-containing protein [Bacteroidales bacterium]
MRKIYSLVLALVIAVPLIAQQRVIPSKSILDYSVTRKHEVAVKGLAENPAIPINTSLNKGVCWGFVEIGTSLYDLQTNASVANRFYRYTDGRMAHVWTRGIDDPDFEDLGTGYNFSMDPYNFGTDPITRIESVRTSSPSYTATSKGELIVSHSANGLHTASRPVFGAGTWTENDYFGPASAPALAWPRVVASGSSNEYVHMVANTNAPYLGQNSAMVYWRSDDGGLSWGIQNQLLPGSDINYYLEIGADEYVWTARENTVALLVASAWHDLFMLKSTDNGQTWTKTVIWEHPYPFFDWNTTIADTFYCVDNSAAIALDPDGKAHIAFGISMVSHLSPGNTFTHYPYVDGIGYWNEDHPTFSNNPMALNPYGYAGSELQPNISLIGWTLDVDGNGQIEILIPPFAYRSFGLSSMPSIQTDEYCGVIIAYSSTTEGYHNGTFNYKHIWVRTSFDYGTSWGDFGDITGGIFHMFSECIYPQIANTCDELFWYLTYNVDSKSGLAVLGDHEFNVNTQRSIEIYPIGIENKPIVSFKVTQNFPNPATDKTYIQIENNKSLVFSLELTTITGQRVYHKNLGSIKPGKHTEEINTKNLKSGIYFYTIRSREGYVTKKMLVR